MKEKQKKLTKEEFKKLEEEFEKLDDTIPATDYDSLSEEEKAEIDSWWEY